ncbi:hypothetical protein Daus18300_012238 [Diaporthe australafricana]|uniref:Uncharacterized protein n=1 Tax=Diaporthe australafricana TaxID=127596 RepID=A0ABR3W3F9_9PEZI
MSSAIASKVSAALATLANTASERTGHASYANAIIPTRSHRNRIFFTPKSQRRHLSDGPQVRPQASATASKRPVPSTKEGRLSVLDRMGANRTTKIVIIVFLSIYGTMETLFYANAAYRYFSKEEV